MYLTLCHPFDIQDLSDEQLQYTLKVILLSVYDDYIDCIEQSSGTQKWI